MENYAIDLLEKELKIIEKCLTDFDEKNYPLAKEDRDLKAKQLKKAIILLNDEKLNNLF